VAAPKAPTASGISRLLAKAGFERSERIPGVRNWGRGNGGFSDGYKVTSDRDGRVCVEHRIGTDRLRDPWISNDAHAAEEAESLAYYGEAIADAGFAAEHRPDPLHLIVTAKEGD
jgi:hypothetical protein